MKNPRKTFGLWSIAVLLIFNTCLAIVAAFRVAAGDNAAIIQASITVILVPTWLAMGWLFNQQKEIKCTEK